MSKTWRGGAVRGEKILSSAPSCRLDARPSYAGRADGLASHAFHRDTCAAPAHPHTHRHIRPDGATTPFAAEAHLAPRRLLRLRLHVEVLREIRGVTVE